MVLCAFMAERFYLIMRDLRGIGGIRPKTDLLPTPTQATVSDSRWLALREPKRSYCSATLPHRCTSRPSSASIAALIRQAR
jgi:hypothetical protein